MNKIILAVVVVIVGVAGYFAFVNKSPQVAQQTNTPTPTKTVQATKAPTATPSVNPTANWKTYTNTQYGYEFKYPEDWNAVTSKYNSGQVLFGPGATNATGLGGVERLGSLSGGQSLKAFVSAFNKGIESGSTSEKEATINGQSVVVSILPKAGGGQTKSVAFLDGNEVFSVYLTNISDKVRANQFDQILSTFKFTK